jgi:hypothetical protein
MRVSCGLRADGHIPRPGLLVAGSLQPETNTGLHASGCQGPPRCVSGTPAKTSLEKTGANL